MPCAWLSINSMAWREKAVRQPTKTADHEVA